MVVGQMCAGQKELAWLAVTNNLKGELPLPHVFKLEDVNIGFHSKKCRIILCL